MKDYIYPLRNVTVDMAVGQERSASWCSPNVQQAPFLQHRKNKIAVPWAACQNPNKHAWCQSSGNKPLQIWKAYALMCGAKYSGTQVTSSAGECEQYKDLSRPIKKTPDCFCSLLNNRNQYFRDS